MPCCSRYAYCARLTDFALPGRFARCIRKYRIRIWCKRFRWEMGAHYLPEPMRATIHLNRCEISRIDHTQCVIPSPGFYKYFSDGVRSTSSVCLTHYSLGFTDNLHQPPGSLCLGLADLSFSYWYVCSNSNTWHELGTHGNHNMGVCFSSLMTIQVLKGKYAPTASTRLAFLGLDEFVSNQWALRQTRGLARKTVESSGEQRSFERLCVLKDSSSFSWFLCLISGA